MAVSYTHLSYLRDAYKTPKFREWPKYATYDAKEIETLCRPDSADYPHIAIYYYIQFNPVSYTQLTKIKELYPEKRVLYVSAHLFQVQYTDSVRNNTCLLYTSRCV